MSYFFLSCWDLCLRKYSRSARNIKSLSDVLSSTARCRASVISSSPSSTGTYKFNLFRLSAMLGTIGGLLSIGNTFTIVLIVTIVYTR